jgi:acetyl esterase
MTASVLTHDISIEDVCYHKVDGEELLATIYRPLGKGPFPAVVSIHGGRWSAENRFTNAPIDTALAEAGILVMAPDFRLAPKTGYPLPVADINVAIRWLKAQATAYNIAVEQIGGVGTSSGGHQLMLNALKPDDPDYSRYAVKHMPDFSDDASLAYAIIGWAVFDPAARYRYALERNMTLHIECHRAYFADEAQMAEASPQRIVTEGEAVHLPPLLVIQGTGDKILPSDMADNFVAAYNAAGGRAAIKKYKDQPHTFITKNPEASESTAAISDMIHFIREQTKTDRASKP